MIDLDNLPTNPPFHVSFFLEWNLCARADTTVNIHACHFDFEKDCLKVGISKSEWNYRHFSTYHYVFANPLMSQIFYVRFFLEIASIYFMNQKAKTVSFTHFENLVDQKELESFGSHNIRKSLLLHVLVLVV